MRYKTLVSNKLDAIKNILDIIARGLERKATSPQEILTRVNNANKIVEETIELLDKEADELGFK